MLVEYFSRGYPLLSAVSIAFVSILFLWCSSMGSGMFATFVLFHL